MNVKVQVQYCMLRYANIDAMEIFKIERKLQLSNTKLAIANFGFLDIIIIIINLKGEKVLVYEFHYFQVYYY